MSETKIRPFPQIPITPEERESKAQQKEPKLPGAPERAYESALMANELGIQLPGLEKVGKDLEKFQGITQSAKQKGFVRQKFNEFYRNPQVMEEFFDILRVLQESGVESSEVAKLFNEIFNEQFDKLTARIETFTPAILGRWLELSVRGPLYKEQAEKILTALFKKTHTVDQTLNLMYDFALATLQSDDPKIFRRGIEILNFGTDILPVNSPQHKNFHLGIFGNDQQLQRQMEIDGVKTHYGLKFMPEVYRASLPRVGEAAESAEILAAWNNLARRDPARMQKLIHYFTQWVKISEQNLGIVEVVIKDPKEWPYNLVLNPGPLRAKYHERLAKEEKNLTNLELPSQGNVLFASKSQEGINATILSDLDFPSEKTEPIATREKLACVFYLSPELSTEQKTKLIEENIKIRELILKERVHSISPRGDRMLIVDETLRALGFKSMTFELSEPKSITKITVEVGKYRFILQLNADLNLEESDIQKPLELPFERRAFLEHVIISHLKELQCTERIKPGSTETAFESELVERQEEFTDRRGHRRQLPQGQSYTPEALRAAWNEQTWDLVKMNAEAHRTKELGMYTYVKIKKGARIGGAPLVSRAPHAMDRFKSLTQENN